MDQLPTPHNNFFHFALSHLPNAKNLIRMQLSKAALAELDLDSLQLLPGTFIDSSLREKFSDLLFSVNPAGSVGQVPDDQALIYLLFEHKSQSDKLTVFQLLSYIVRIWERRLRDGLCVCPVIPIVVYHGESEWTAARSRRELIGGSSALADYQVDFRFALLDLNQLEYGEIEGEPILQSTLRLLKYSRSQQLTLVLKELLRLVIQSLPVSLVSSWINAIGVYVMSVNKDINAEEYKQTLKSVLPVQFEPGSLADRLLIQGREEGREEGEQFGVLKGKILMLQELLGELPMTDAEFKGCTFETLVARLATLQQRLRDRQV